jgi:hypothetical protein
VPVLEASKPFLFFDYFRVPYVPVADALPGAEACEWARAPHTRRGRVLAWRAGTGPAAAHRIGTITIHARVANDAEVEPCLEALGGDWRPIEPVVDERGRRVGNVWRTAHGGTFLPFDPDEAIVAYWTETYRGGGTLGAFARRAYYRLRPVLPRRVQIGLRRLLSRAQGRASFPAWPVETGLHDLFGILFEAVAGLADEPVPWIAPWPKGRSWALVLTHDVETAGGYAGLERVRDAETSAGYRSSWNFVPERYGVDDALVEQLTRDGFEVGVHGLRHDGRDLESLATLRRRLPAIRGWAERWQAVGFRSPATHRKAEWMPLLGFDYDSSYPDTDPYEPQAGGCCSWLPYFNESLVELPITVPQDHTVFSILQHENERIWIEKIDFLRGRGGMALLITHPDYMLEGPVLPAYERLLGRYAADAAAWRPLPREVAAWWRRRASSHVERTESGWHIVGPAAGEAAVAFAGEPA